MVTATLVAWMFFRVDWEAETDRAQAIALEAALEKEVRNIALSSIERAPQMTPSYVMLYIVYMFEAELTIPG